MTLDQLLDLLSATSNKVLPILGVIALIFLLVLLKKLITFFVSLNKTLEDVQKVVETTDKQLRSLDKPLETLNNLSETVDNVNEVSKNIVRSSLVAFLENFASIKDWVLGFLKQDPEAEEATTEEVNN